MYTRYIFILLCNTMTKKDSNALRDFGSSKLLCRRINAILISSPPLLLSETGKLCWVPHYTAHIQGSKEVKDHESRAATLVYNKRFQWSKVNVMCIGVVNKKRRGVTRIPPCSTRTMCLII